MNVCLCETPTGNMLICTTCGHFHNPEIKDAIATVELKEMVSE